MTGRGGDLSRDKRLREKDVISVLLGVILLIGRQSYRGADWDVCVESLMT